MKRAYAKIMELQDRYLKVAINNSMTRRYNPGLMNVLELRGMLEMAELIVGRCNTEGRMQGGSLESGLSGQG